MLPSPNLAATIFPFLIRSQILMSVSSVLFVWICAALTGHVLPWHWYCVAGVGCWAVYLADAGLLGVPAEDRINLPERAQFIERSRGPLRLALVIALACLALGFVWRWPWPRGITLLILGTLAAAGALYVFPLLRRRDLPSLRVKEVALWKPAFISAVWLAGGMLLPFLEGHPVAPPAAPFGAVAALLFLLLLGDSIALDWRDRAGDAATGLRTAAVRLGPRGCPLLLGLNALAAGALVLCVPGDARWHAAGGAMAAAHALSLMLLPLANRSPLLFYCAVAAWRFAGPAALLLLG